MKDQHICPVCFALYPSSSVGDDWPMCPDCESEAISVEVEPIADFLARHSPAELQQIADEWDAATDSRESYKQTKQKRIARAIELKRGAG